MNTQLTIRLNHGVEMPMAEIGTLLLTPDETGASPIAALDKGVRCCASTPELLNRYVAMVPPADEQK